MPVGSIPTMAASIHFYKPANPSSLFSNASGSTTTPPLKFTALATCWVIPPNNYVFIGNALD